MALTNKPKIGIDLVHLEFRQRAAGTARHVEEQARALFKMDLPWTWFPIITTSKQKLYEEIGYLRPHILSVNKLSIYATFKMGKIWEKAGCSMGFATAYLVPAGKFPIVTNFFDGHTLIDNRDIWHRRHKPLSFVLMNALLRYSINRSRKLFVLSKYYRDKLVALYPGLANKFVVCPCGAPPPRQCPTEPPAWLKFNDKGFFLFVGVFSDNKNQKTLLKAWSMLQKKWPDLPELVMIGAYSETYYNSVIIPLLQALPRPDEILMPGYASEDDLAWCYHKAVGYVQPSISEGFGLPVIEAMSYDLSVGCSNTTSLPETAGDAALFFNPLDIYEMADVLVKLWLDRGVRDELIRRGRVHWEKFTWENNAKIVAQNIDEILSNVHY